MTDQKPPFYGDPNMLMPLKESDVLSIRTKNALIGDKKIYLADILQYPEKWLLRTPYFGPKGLNEVLMMLQDMSDETATYELPKAIDFNILFDGNKDKIEQHYGLGSCQPKPMHGFAASDFEIVAANAEDGHVVYDIQFKDSELRQQWTNLVNDGYVRFSENDEDTPDQVVFRDSVNANCAIATENNEGVALYFDSGSESLTALATGNILEGFAKAVNEVMPRAQQRFEDSIIPQIEEKRARYGIAPTA